MAKNPFTFFTRLFGQSAATSREMVRQVERGAYEYSESLTTASLSGNGVVGSRSRQIIYQKYQQMMADPVVSGAIRLHVTAALGGHETSGDLVFIESKADEKGKKSEKLVEELSAELGPLINRVAFQLAYNAAGYGDAFGRVYSRSGVGVVGLLVDEMLLPPLVLPYEQGGQTRVCRICIGPKLFETLTMDQIMRVKMPRLIYTPQPMAIEKAWRTHIAEDDMDALPLMPALVGGSFLADAEQQYDNFASTLVGLVGQRVLDSIDESMLAVNVVGLTTEQRQQFLSSITNLFKKSKQVAEEAVALRKPFLGRIRHIIPIWNDKQVVDIKGVNSSGGSGSGRASNIAIDDVMFHAKLLSGALGIDLSMLGFADLLSGGLGDGGFFRTSAQAAERSRTIRVALTEAINHVIDVHLIAKTGRTFPEDERPWTVNFYANQSAVAREMQATKLDGINSTLLLAQAIQQLAEAGLSEASIAQILEQEAKIDAKAAKAYAKDAVKEREAKIKRDQEQSGGGGFGGFGGGGDSAASEPAPPPKQSKKPALATGDGDE